MKDDAGEVALTAVDLLKAAAQVSPPTAVVAGLVDVIQQHRARKQMRFLLAVVEHHEGAIADLETRMSDEKVLELVSSAYEAAAEAHAQDKILLLADIAGETIRPDTDAAKVDTGQYLIDVMAGLDTIDIDVLRVIATPRAGSGQLAGQAVVGGMNRQQVDSYLATSLVESRDVAVARLTAAGLIENQALGAFGGGAGSAEQLGPTAAGTWVIAALERLHSG